MKVALVNDTHFGARNDAWVFNEYFFRFWENNFFPYLKEHNINHVFHLGDFVDRRKFINYQIMSSLRQRWIEPILNSGVTIDFLVGNHDCPLKNTNYPNAIEEICSGFKGINIYAKPTEIVLGGLPIALLPWVNTENETASLELIRNTKAQIVLGHLELQGFEMERGNVCYVGTLPREELTKFDMVISGHFHHRSSDGLIYYLGNQYEITWSDYNDTRGFHVFDTDTRDLEFIPNPNRMFHKITYNDSKETLDSIKALDVSFTSGCYVKILVENKTNPYWFDFFLDKVYKAGAYDISIVEDFSAGLLSFEDDEKGEGDDDTITMLEKSVDSLKDSVNLDIDRLKRELRNIHNEAVALEVV